LHVPLAEAGWHFANFDAKRREGPVHRGTAGEHEYIMLTRMADIRALFPNTIFMDIMGLPRSDAEQFQQWEAAMLHTSGPALGEEQMPVMMAVVAYFTELIADRRKQQRDDLLSGAVTWQIDGQPIPMRICSRSAC